MTTETFDASRSTVLIVDDEKDVHYSFQRFLAPLQCRVDSALSGEEALSRLDGKHLVILDVKLGGDDGLRVLREIRERDPHLPVIMMTAYGTTETAIEATRRGAYDYVVKPFDPPKMKDLVVEATRCSVCGVKDSPFSTSRSPNPFWNTSLPSRTTATAVPGTCQSRRSPSMYSSIPLSSGIPSSPEAGTDAVVGNIVLE